jgi:arylformamidase
MGRTLEAGQLRMSVDLHPLDAAGSVPDVTAYLRRYVRESGSAREEHAPELDIAYGSLPVERLDFFSAGPATPLAIFFHGGYWRRLDKSDFSFIAHGLLPLGISFVSVNYGLAPHTPLAEIVAQTRRALAWCRDHHSRLRIDSDRISVLGHSAGGHLAAMAAVAHPVRAVATLSGLHDLEPIRQSFVNEWLNLDMETAHALSPIRHTPANAFRLFASAGERESEDGFKAQGRALVSAWSTLTESAEYADSPGDNHFTNVLRLRSASDPLTLRIAQLCR